MDIISSTMIMIVGLFLMRFIVPMFSSVRIVNLFIILIYTLVGGIIYLFFTYKCGVIKRIFGNKLNNIFVQKK